MKLTVLQENLSRAVTLASRFTTAKAQLPILGNIKLSTKKTKLLISSTNLEVSSCISIVAQIQKEGEIAVPSKILSEIVVNLQPGNITLEVEKEQLKISSSGFSSQISGMNTSDFPTIPQKVNEKNLILLPKEDFREGLSQVLFSTSPDETRPILTGVLIIFAKEELVLVGTDGFRLSQKKIKTALKGKNDTVVLPKTVLTELTRTVSEKEEILFDYKKGENQVVLGVDDTILCTRILEGEFPDYEKIIPKSTNVKVFLDKEEFSRAVKLASVFARDSANIVKILVAKEGISLSAESQTSGSQKTKIDAKVEGESLEIAFNFRFLEEFIHSVKGEEIKMEFSNANSPGIFTDPSDKNYLHLIMPVKIQG